MTNVKPHFECSGYGCNDCSKGVVIEETRIFGDIPNMRELARKSKEKENVINVKINTNEIVDMLLKLIDEKIKHCPIVTHGARKGYFVEIEE